MASRQVARYLQTLHRHCANESQDAPAQAQQTIQNLQPHLIQNLTNEEQDLCSAMLFESSESAPDLLTEFTDSLIDKRYTVVRYQIVKLIIDYIDHIGRNIVLYASRIQCTMVQCINNDQSDRTKSTALQCLDKLYLLNSLEMHSNADDTNHDEDNDIKMEKNYNMSIDNVINTLYSNLNLGTSKLRGTVRGGILRLLGILSNRYPTAFTRIHLDKLSKEYTKYIAQGIENSSSLQPKLMSGCLNGLQYFLNEHCHFIPDRSKDKHNRLTIFKAIVITIREVQSEQRYNMVIASLDLLGTHSFIFYSFIAGMISSTAKLKKAHYANNKANDILQLVLDLSINHSNFNVSLSAMSCIESMLSSITSKLLESHSDLNKKIYKMLIHTFVKLLNTSIANAANARNHKQMSLSIRAFGELAASINEYGTKGQLKQLLSSMVQVSKKCVIFNENETDSLIQQFPSFLSAFSSFIYHIDFVDDEVIDQLSLMINTIFEEYPSTWNKLRYKLYESMTKLFVILYLKGNIFNKLLQNIIYRGLTYSITTLNENCIGTKIADSSKQSGIRIRRCYEEYYTFWKGLLMISNDCWNKGLSFDIGESDTYLREMQSLLFASLMHHLINILNEFNLSFKLKDDGTDIINYQMIMNSIADNAELQNANDMELFLNYVEFVQLFLSKLCKEYLINKNKRKKEKNAYFKQFQSWAMMYIETVIEITNKNPMISGLYKILKSIFSLYSESTEEKEEKEEEDIIMIDDTKSVKLDIYYRCIIRNFIDKCLSKLQTYRDELLYSLIELLLNIPKSFIPIKYLIAALLRSLKIGLTYIIAGELAVTVLEKWCDEYFDEIKEYLDVILPHLEPYLSITKETMAGIASTHHQDEDEEDEKHIIEEEQDEHKEKVKKKKSSVNNIDEENVEYERKKRLIKRILFFLGKLGGYNESVLKQKVTNKVSDAQAAGKGLFVDTDIIAWDKHQRVRYVWAFPDTKLTVYLDPLLPRICELALQSPDRRAKVAASEALHGIIIKMVSDNATDPNMNKRKKHDKQDFEKIYQKLFPVVLHLAVSTEKVCNQLFHPLVIQLIHWFTQNIKKDNDETIALLDAITDGLGDENNAALRDFCGECMAEFVKWSLKHSGSIAGSLNIQSLLRRLYALIRHPSPYRRLGSCLTFHYIYRNIREEKVLVSRFILDILTNLIESLGVAHYDTSGINTIDETRRCIKNFEKIIINKKHGYWHLLNKLDKNRQGGLHCKDLSSFVEWCFENLGRIEIDCRRQSMQLIQSLAPYSLPINNLSKDVAGTVSKWFTYVIKSRKIQYIVSVFEGGRSYDEDNNKSVLQQLTESLSLNQYKKWLENLSTSLDNYYWMAKSKIIDDNNKLFTQTHFKSYLFESCKDFLSTFQSLNSGSIPFKKELNKLRCDTIIRFYRFIDIMLRNDLFTIIQVMCKYELFYQLLIISLIYPDSVGFIEDDPSRIKELQNQFKSVISAICHYSNNDNYKKYLIKICKGYIIGKVSPNMDSTALSIKYTDWTTLHFFKVPGKALLFLRGIQILSKAHNILQSALDNKCCTTALNMADDVFSLCDEPQNPMNIRICSAMLSLSLRLGLPSNNLIQYLSDQTKIPLAHSHNEEINENRDLMDQDDDDEDDEDILAMDQLFADTQQTQNGSKGIEFYQRFADVLDSYFLSNFNTFSNIILERIGDKNMEESEHRQLMLILTTVLKHIIQDSSTDQTLEFLSNLMEQFSNKSILDLKNEENVRLHLSIIAQYLMKCNSKTVFEDNVYIQTTYSNALKNGKQPSAQLQAIKMLPLFIIDPDNLFPWLLQSMHEMIINSFPNSSHEAYNKGQSEWKDYVQKLQSILDTITISQSFALIKVIIPLLREKQHKNKTQIEAKLDDLIGKLTTPLNQAICLKFLSLATDCFFDQDFDTNSVDNARRWMVESLCVPILESCAISCVDRYFQRFAKQLFDIICKYPNGPNRNKDQDTVRLQLLELECAYKLLSLQYQRLHKTSVTKIGVEYKKVIKTSHNHVKKFGVQGKQESTSQIAFHCAAYNCLTQCILCTQKDKPKENIWSMLFTEKPNTQLLWANIIDLNVDLLLSIETNFAWSLRKIKRKFVQAQSEMASSTQNMLAFDAFMTPSQSLLNKSSLSQDVPYSFQPKRNHANEDENAKEEEKEAMDVDDDDDQKDDEIVLELDPLNAMPIMGSMLSAMDGLQKHFGDKWCDDVAVVPKWMTSLLSKLQERDTFLSHPNVRWFIAKLIVNRPKIFEPFCRHFFKPLVDLCLLDDVNHWGFHYFLRDICELFIFKWRSFIPDTITDDTAQRFINHLINMATDIGGGTSKNAKIKQNVNYISLLLRKWKGMQSVSKKCLYQLLSVDIKRKPNTNELRVGDTTKMEIQNKNNTTTKVVPIEIIKRNKKGNIISYRVKVPGNKEMDDITPGQIRKRDFRLERMTGLWIIDALIEADFPAFDADVDTDELDIGTFFNAFCSNMDCDSRPVWKLAAKVYGDLLRKEEENHRKLASFQASFSIPECVERIKKIISKTMNNDLPKAIEIMHRIGNEYPEFLDYKLMQKILGTLAHIPVSCLTDSISLFAKYVSVANPDPEVAIWLRPGLQRLYDHNDIDAHLALCDVFLRLIPVINLEIKQDLLKNFISYFKSHQNSRVRRKLLGILSFVYDNEPDIDPALKNDVKDVLLAGLADSNHVNRKLMFEFWGHSTRLNTNIVERLDDLLHLFTTSNEHLWLHYACFLLLEPMRKSPDFNQLISHRPLSECRFEEINIESEYGTHNLMTQNFAMTPMFTSSLPSTQKPTDEQQTLLSFASLTSGSQQPSGYGYIRATQQRVWTQTQQTDYKLPSPLDKPERSRYGSGKNDTFMWTQNINDIGDGDGLQDLFAGSYADFERGPQGNSMINNKSSSSRLRILTPTMSQRFSAKDSNAKLSQKIGRYDMAKRYRNAWDETKKESAAHRVSLFRKYRVGELPDICIPHSDIQLPLQALHTDHVIAKQLFLVFFEAIYKEAIDRSSRATNYKQMIETSMTTLLLKCNENSSTISTLLLCSTFLSDINVEPKYIADLSIQSNNLYSGVILLETMLSNGESIEEQQNKPKRRRLNEKKNVLTFNEQIYRQLSRLYNLLSDQDTVVALSSCFAKMQETKDGVEFYMKGDYCNAYENYLSAQNIAKHLGDRCQASILEQNLWKEEAIKCLRKMAKWDIIYKQSLRKISDIDKDYSFKDNLWTFLLKKEDYELTELSMLQSYFEDWLLSSVKSENVWKNELYPLLDEWIMNNKQKRDHIENHYSPILAFLYATKNDLIRTKYYINKSYTMLLDKWCGLPKFAINAKKGLLSTLQSLVEITEFVNIVKMETNKRNDENINDSEDILSFWKRRFPKTTDDVIIWDDILFYRQMFAKNINEIQSAQYLTPLVTECQVDTLYQSINSMIYQKNYSVAQNYMESAALLGSFNPKFKIQKILLNLNSTMDNHKKNVKEKVQSLRGLNEKLTNYLNDATMNHLNNDIFLLKAKILFKMASFADDDGSLLRYVGNTNNVDDVYKESRTFYKKCLASFGVEEEYSIDDDETKQKLVKQHQYNHSKAHIELALFCNQRLLYIEEKVRKDFEKQEKNKIKLFTMTRQYSAKENDLAKEFIHNIMRAIMHNSAQARDLFPRVLELAEMNVSVLAKLMINQSQRIPCWMFIRWIAQMLAELGSLSLLRDYIFPILTRIAKMYPGALMYPFNLTSEDLQDDEGAQRYIKQLSSVLQENHPGYEIAATFTQALDCMCHPNMKFKDYRKEILGISNDKRLNKKSKLSKIEQCMKEMIHDLFTKSKKYVKTLIGSENQRFISLFEKIIFNKFGKNAEKVKRMDVASIVKVLKSIVTSKHFASFDKKKGKLPLKQYSDWLSSFDCSKFDETLYVPGQFTGITKPDLAQHLKIVSFDSTTLIMSSLRKPKRIKLRTNDEREQMWLAKAGEDLRMDQRIEEMFKIINTILCKNTLCIERELVLRTYEVIPLNRSTGIIEWIDNTIPIKALIEDSMKRLKLKQSMNDIILKDYIPPFSKLTRKQHGPPMYTEGILKYNTLHKKLLASFERTQNKLPATTLQLSIINMARNKESYIQLRSRFCKTLSVYTICGYILGIGDRHLDNYLVDESTGQVIGIDFGAAFGYGLCLPVPEMMPCRLTRQFLNIMSPLNTKILIRNYMIYAMSAITQKKDNLLNIMNVFIKEPSLDWIELANKNFAKSNAKVLIDDFEDLSLSVATTSEKKELMWFPKHKIYIAKLKLNGFKSTYVMVEEIASTQHFTAAYRASMERIINGFSADKLRKRFTKDKCECVEDQIDCLIDHADDKHILSLTWQGWASWI